MKKSILSAFLLLFVTAGSWASTVITEGFATGLPTTSPTTETTATLSSGVWTIKGVKEITGTYADHCVTDAGGYIISPAINKPTSITFKHKSSGAGKIITAEKSVNGGAWVSIGTGTTSSSGYITTTLAINEGGANNVKIKLTSNSGSVYIDDLSIDASDMADEPATQASIVASNITGSTATITITAGSGAGRLLAYKKASDLTWVPADGTVYADGAKPDADHTVAYSGTDATVNVTGLEAGETYYFGVFEYTGNGENRNYLTSTIGKTNFATLQVPSIALSYAAINFGSVKVGNSDKRTVTLSAKYLSPADGNITITGSAEFQVSTSSASGFANSITVPYTANSLVATTIYIQFTPTAYVNYSQAITFAGGTAATQTLTAVGIGSNTDVKVYYISPSGDDANPGTFDQPIKNLQIAADKMVPGDTLYCRGGEYFPTTMKDGTKTTVRLYTIGSADKMLTIKNYPGEFPIFNFKSQPKKVSVRGVQLNGEYYHIYGLHFTEAGDNGMKLEGNHNIIERCTFSKNDDTGLQLGFGHIFSDTHPGISSNDGSYCCYNDIIDCDAYLNCDSDNGGADADGFACKMHNGIQNRFIRCRAYDNSDDAWDLYETDFSVYLVECWAWGSGRAENFTPPACDWTVISGFQGNGNGIKLGGNGTGGSSKGIHEVWNCIAFNCNKTGSVKGFDQNSHGGGEKLVNCLAFGNGYDFMFEIGGANLSFYNNVCFGSMEIGTPSTQGKNADANSSSKGWTNNVCTTFTTSDYNSLAETDAKKPRGNNGSMPTTFARLKQSSVLIDKGEVMTNANPQLAGIDLFLGYSGATRDLGPYEYGYTSAIADQVAITGNNTLQLSANPMMENGYVHFGVTETADANVSIYSLQGLKVAEIFNSEAVKGAEYDVNVPVNSLANGVYVVVLQTATETTTAKFVVKH